VRGISLKKLILITNPLFVRNYIDSGAFNNIKDANTYLICTRSISNKEKLSSDPGYIGEFEASRINKFLFNFITLLLMYSNRRQNKGFYFYFKQRNTTLYYPSLRLKNIVFERFNNKFLRLSIIKFIEMCRPFTQPFKLFSFCCIVLIDFLALSNLIVKIYNSLLINNKELKLLIKKINPDIVLIPNGGLSANAHEALSLSKKLNFKSMLLIDNWDNLCSKSRFPIEPDYLGVWGDQARSHALKLHKIESHRVFLAGTPRFDGYQIYKYNKNLTEQKYKNVLNFPYILFAGCWPTFDEIGVIEKLDSLIEKYKNILPKNCKILYRPHPWGENYDKLDQLNAMNLNNLEIDPQMAKKSRPDDWTKRTDFQPELDYYPLLLDKCEFVISPMSTILIEASMMNKKVLALAHDDGKSFLNPSFMYKNSDYFDRLSELKSLRILHDIINLDELFYEMATSDMLTDKEALSYYIVNDGLLYSERIEKIYNNITLNC
jgi:hypothetical protein